LTFSIVDPPINGALSVVTQLPPTGASVLYTPPPDFFGSDEFTFLVDDGRSTAVAIVSIEVAAVNDAPSFMVGPDQNSLSDALPVSVPGWATSISAGPANESAQNLTFIVASNDNPSLFSGGPAIDTDGTLSYTSVLNATGTATVGVQLMDDGGTDNGGVDASPVQTFTITLMPPNFMPVADSIAVSTDEELPVTITLTASDMDGDPLTFAIVAGSGPGNGTLSALMNPTPTSAQVIYTPNADFFGTDSFMFVANDGIVDSAPATVDITVRPVNDPPSFVGGGDVAVAEDSGLYSRPWASAVSTGPANELQTPIFTVTQLATDNPLLFALPPSLDSTGLLTFTPADDSSGTATFEVVLSDGIATATGMFAIMVSAVNDAPSDIALSNQSIDESVADVPVPAGSLVGTLTTVDVDDATHTYTVAPTTEFDITSNQLVTVRALNYEAGETTFTVTITSDDGDPGGTLSQTFAITVNDVNDPPAAGNDDYTGGVGNTPFAVIGTLTPGTSGRVELVGSVLDDDTDEEVDLAGSQALDTSSADVNVVMNADGTFVYTPPAGVTGNQTFLYQVCDNDAADRKCAIGTVAVDLDGLVWYVDNTTAGAGDGTSANPFPDLSSLAGTNTGDVIYVFAGDQNYSGVTLLNDQQLLGEGVALIVNGTTLLDAGTRPTVGAAGATGVALAANNTVRGIDIQSTRGMTGAAVGLLEVDNVSITSNGDRALNIAGGAVALTFDDLTTAGSIAGGVRIDNVGGTLDIAGATTIAHTAGIGIDVRNSGFGTGDRFDFGATTVTGPSGIELTANGTTAVFDFGSVTINTSNGNGLVIRRCGWSAYVRQDQRHRRFHRYRSRQYRRRRIYPQR
jgi:hypothetical protein